MPEKTNDEKTNEKTIESNGDDQSLTSIQKLLLILEDSSTQAENLRVGLLKHTEESIELIKLYGLLTQQRKTLSLLKKKVAREGTQSELCRELEAATNSSIDTTMTLMEAHSGQNENLLGMLKRDQDKANQYTAINEVNDLTSPGNRGFSLG